MPKHSEHAWHALSAAEAEAELGSSPRGLSSEEARKRLAEHGPNELARARRISALSVLLDQVKNVLVVVLFVAVGLSIALGHTTEAIAIGVIVLFAVLLGFVQEYRAERSLEALRQLAAPLATVIRDGAEQKLPARELVAGDLLILHAGDKIPADARLLESVNLQAEEAALTGESVPVEKLSGPLSSGTAALADRKNMVFAGTAVTYGRGRAVVVATGSKTELGKIAESLEQVEATKTPLQNELDAVGKALVRVAFGAVAVIIVLGLVRGQPFVEMLIFGIALAVAVVPEALPAVVTISLALGVQRLVKKNALVRRLSAAEALGSTTVICSDKTGTLTKDEMTVRAVRVAERTVELEGAGWDPAGEIREHGEVIAPFPELLELATAGALASDADVKRSTEGRWEAAGDPTEAALVVLARKLGLDRAALQAAAPRVGEVPFTSESKRMTTIHRRGSDTVAYVKGAPEVVLAACSHVATASGPRALDDAGRARELEVATELAAKALRVLAVAKKDGATEPTAGDGLVLLGLVGMIDPPRPEAKLAVDRCKTAGVRVVMISGDHPITARAVARELGILDRGEVITGAELTRLDDAQLAARVKDIEVYARVSPADKLRVVGALQALGHVVAMTGDGVNDAPALKKADIGVAMGINGTDVTREAAAMTLTDDNFASIVRAVEEGRIIFGNIKKYLMYLLSSNVGEIGLMAGASLFGLPLPLSAVQILYVNLATDGLPALALAVDPPDDDLMTRPPRDPKGGIFTRPLVTLVLVGGVWSSILNVGLFAWAYGSGRSAPEAMTMSFLVLVLIQFVKAYCFRSDRRSVLVRPFANKWLNLAIVWELLLLGLILYVPALERVFGTFALTPIDWVIIVLSALSVAPVLDGAKALARRGLFGKLD